MPCRGPLFWPPLGQSGCDDALFWGFKKGEKLHTLVALFFPQLDVDLICRDCQT